MGAAAKWTRRRRRPWRCKGATEGIVLLKNDGGLLPLDASEGSLDCGDRAECGGGAHGRRRQLAGAAEACDCAAGWDQGAGSENIAVSYALGVGMEGEDPAQDTPEARAQAI